MVTEIITEWSIERSSGGMSIMYFADEGGVAAQRAALADFWSALAGILDQQTSWRIQTTGRILDEASGTLTGLWSDPTNRAGNGNQTGEPVSNSTQALIRWVTDDVVNGRRIRGRTFIPGLTNKAITAGEVSASALNAMETAAAAYADASGLVIWHRPDDSGSGGSVHSVTASSVWNEFAVLRGRRD